MRELPLIFDEPVATPLAAGLTTSRQGPLWMAPALLIGRFRPRLRAAALADAISLEKYPRILVETLPLLLVLVLAGGFSASHAMHHYQTARAGVEWTRLGLADTYLEIPIFLLLAILVGQALPSLGVLLVLVFGVLDIVVAATQPDELIPLPSALVGRLIALWALWLLVVEVPVFSRWMAGSWRAVAGTRVVIAALAAISAGSFTWLWTLAVPIMTRPMFVWSKLSGVAIAAVRPVQESGIVFAIFAGLVAGFVALSRGREGILDEGPVAPRPGRGGEALAILKDLVVAALITLTLGGILASPFEAILLFAAVATSGPLARILANRTIIGTVVRVAPPALRYAAGAGLAIAVSAAMMTPLYRMNITANIGHPEAYFFSVVFAVSATFFVVAIATTPGTRSAEPPPVVATTLLLMGAGVVWMVLASPVVALADNCSGINDCWGTPIGAALAAAAIPPLLSAARTPPETPDEKKWRDRRLKEAQREKDWWSKNGRTPQEKHDRMGYQDKRIKYYSNPAPPMTSDGKSTDDHALASSGAGTRG
ncbi:MAG: hypothetical protein QOK05_111 [Chloroflexota bacterium]|nr:hypothetical protein [Chloroflexota bacterium]